MSIRRMEGRDINERHRTSTTLELLFDLIIVVAVAQAAGGLHHMLAEGMYATGAVRYMMAFWCVFIGWMNFSWFASAYDTDDVPYRITTAIQMLGAMILAAGIGDIFLHTPDLTTAFIGFVIMRLAMVTQWLRAARQHEAGLATCLRYAVGTALAQALWSATLFSGGAAQTAVFAVAAMVELAVPYIAERKGGTPWHPHHIAERYGLLVIIVLGECVAGIISMAAKTVHEDMSQWAESALPVIVSSLATVFAMWWTYFKLPTGSLLAGRRGVAFPFAYIHYLIFASLASLGAGLGLQADSLAEPENGQLVRTAVITTANACGTFLVLVSILNIALFRQCRNGAALLAIAILTPAVPMAMLLGGISLKWVVMAAALAPALYVRTLDAGKC